jgi:dihydroflavonol-4-reductase
MKVFIAGGTGLLGYHGALELLHRGHDVRTAALPDIALGQWWPSQIQVEHADLFALDARALSRLMEGCDALVYALGPDDRETPPAPAYAYFHERLVLGSGRVIAAAREAGVRRCTVLGSYYATFQREWPRKRLADHHPYVRCRVEQAERAMAEGHGRMAVNVLELPYIFGAMPQRVPLWKKLLFDPLRRMPVILYPDGGSAMTTAEHVGQAIAGAVERGGDGERHPIGDENLTWDEMLHTMLDALGLQKRIVHLPALVGMLFGYAQRRGDARRGRERGLNHGVLFRDTMSERMYLDPVPSSQALGHDCGGVREAIAATVRACYPDRFSRADTPA